MIKRVLLPQLELNMESVTVTSWLVAQGDRVEAGQPILEVETQKATVQVPSLFAGYIRRWCVQPRQVIAAKALLCLMSDSANELLTEEDGAEGPDRSDASRMRRVEDQSEPAETRDLGTGDIVRAAPAARTAAKRLGIDIGLVVGTGPSGRVTLEDVELAAAVESADAASARRVCTPLPATRLALIRQMQQSLAEIPQFHVGRQIDVSRLMMKAQGITFTHRIIRATSAALVHHPALRAVIDGSNMRVEPVNIAVAMDTPQGLIAPVIRNADGLTLLQIAKQLASLRSRGEANRLIREDFANGPFAISNLGMLGVDVFSPFVFHGQTAVLGIGRAIEVLEGRNLAWFMLAADHRVVDGAEAARFLATLQEECLRT